jgi:hypothetical protein
LLDGMGLRVLQVQHKKQLALEFVCEWRSLTSRWSRQCEFDGRWFPIAARCAPCDAQGV